MFRGCNGKNKFNAYAIYLGELPPVYLIGSKQYVRSLYNMVNFLIKFLEDIA